MGGGNVSIIQELLWGFEPRLGCSARAGTTEKGSPGEGAAATRDTGLNQREGVGEWGEIPWLLSSSCLSSLISI